MADNDNKRRFRRPARSQTNAPARRADAASVFPQENNPAPGWAQPTPSRRAARDQARQDVSDVTTFLSQVGQQRARGNSAPTPRPMRDVLGAFNSSPRDQTMIQVLAAAATARHLEGAQSANAQRWELLAQDNAARLEAMRIQQRRSAQEADRAARLSSEQIQQREAERVNNDEVSDKRVFDAAAAIALGYVAARGLPSFAKLESLSGQHLDTLQPEPELTVDAHPDTEAEMDRDPDLDVDVENDVEPELSLTSEAVDASAELESVATPETGSGSTSESGGASTSNDWGRSLERAGRGLANAVGPMQGEDEVAANLSPVNLSQLSPELLDALSTAKRGHPRSVTEMLNIERAPDQTNEVAFAPDTGAEHDRSMEHDM